jgi:alginate O-acetyltransferase complex protein AlgI
MLFNSFEFLFAFLPITLLGFLFFGRINQTVGAAWLFFASVFFYGWWDPKYIWLLLGSIIFHFYAARLIQSSGTGTRKLVLASAITIDIAVLIYYKYSDLFIVTWNELTAGQIQTLNVLLPLGISFFTFTQIAFLVDTYENKVNESRPVYFGLFVTYFPHLIAGPVLHHGEMMPQFANPRTYSIDWKRVALGFGIFVIGLSKKVLLADNLAPFVSSAFADTSKLDFTVAWLGVLAYTFQLYFDFSGYSDMAVGLSLVFGIKLPLNFFSPYKAKNISQFWRCWHMTLSRFLRDYLYIRLGGNRKGKVRRYINLILTMFLGGLWHGAGWNFALWGLLHGIFLCIHEGWRATFGKFFQNKAIYGVLSIAITFFAVAFAWVPFRASTLSDTLRIWAAMIGANGIALPDGIFLSSESLSRALTLLGVERAVGGTSRFAFGTAWILVGAAVAFLAPNTTQIFGRFDHAFVDSNLISDKKNRWYRFHFNQQWAIVLALLFIVCLLYLGRPSEFLYFQF